MSGTLAPRLDRLEKNYLINGAFDFWQRAGASSAVNTTTSSSYLAMDRWKVFHTGTFTGTPNVVRDNTSLPDSAFPYAMKHSFQRNASTATLTYEQRVESLISTELSSIGYASLSLWVHASVTGTVQVTIYTPTVTDNHASQTQQYQSSQSITAASTWQQMKFEGISIPGAANLGLAVKIEFIMASATDGSVQTFRMSRNMLNAGKKAADYQRFAQMYDQELSACKRYYEKNYDLDTPVGTVTGAGAEPNTFRGFNTGTVATRGFSLFMVEKRSGPSMTFWSGTSATSGNVDVNGVAVAIGAFAGTRTGTWVEYPTGVSGAYTMGFHFSANSEIA